MRSRRDCWREQVTIENGSIDRNAGVACEELVVEESRLAVPEPMNAAARSVFLRQIRINETVIAQQLHRRRREHLHRLPARGQSAVDEQHRATSAAQECSTRAAGG